MKLESLDIIHPAATGYKSDERRDVGVLDVRKTNMYAILLEESSNPVR